MPGFEVLTGNEAVSALSEFDFSEEPCTFFQSPGWLRLWNAQPRYECGLLALSGGGKMAGFFPFCIRRRSGFRECYSMPMGTYGGAVAPREARERASDSFVKWSSENGFSRINVVEYTPDENRFFGSFCKTRHTTQVLSLDRDPDGLYGGLSDHHKRSLKEAARFDSRIVRVSSESHVKEYFRLARESAGRHGSSPTYSLDFYIALRRIVPENNLIWRLLYLDGKPCVGLICFKWGKQIISWDGCSDKLARATSVNYSLYWHNIKEFSEQGCVSFNFGTSPPGLEGVLRFKAGWGVENVMYFEYDRQTLAYSSLRRLRDWLGR